VLFRSLNLLATDSRVKVISSPHIMVTDNQTAKIQVGDRVPITSQTQSVLGSVTGLIASIQYIDTGILLTVTPRINAGGQVTMNINQEVSAASITTTSSINSPTISKRAVATTVVVKSGETMVLGGLITDNKTTASSGLPYLSKIPFIGGLFGTQTFNNTRTELVLMITPRLVANNQQAHDVSEEFRKKLSGLGDIFEGVGKSNDMPKKPAGLNELLDKVGKPGDTTKQMDKQVK
jgi:general secretion pathway protein D